MAITEIKKCRKCGSESLTWDTHSKADSGVLEGRLRSNEVKCLFVLGCDDCSETLAILSADRVAGLLNAARTPATAVE
ncbi:hypothetical protein ACK8QS_22730 (plasmid) [Ectopseudomonas mendocina]